MGGIKLTDEQRQVVDALSKFDVLRINAFAGSGKTFTLKELTTHYPDLKFLYLAFNRSIANEAKRKFNGNTDIYTTHGLAFKYTRGTLNIRSPRGDYKARELMDILSIPEWVIANLILQFFNAYCYSEFREINKSTINSLKNRDVSLSIQYQRVSDEYKDIDLGYIASKVGELWSLMENGKIAVTHNFYLKYFQVNMDKYLRYLSKYDVVLLDEAQDTNAVTLAIISQLPMKKVIVGDRHQQIYGFRKSLNAMEKFKADKTLYLSISFRITDEIAKRASNLLKVLKGEKKPISATKKHDPNLRGNKAIITRTNSALIGKLEGYIGSDSAGEITTVRDPEDIFRLPLSLYYFQLWKDTGDYEIKRKIRETWLLQFRDLDEIEEYAGLIEDVELMSALKLIKDGVNIPRLYGEAKKLYNNPKATIFLTTAHTSKGLEWDEVHLTSDFPNLVEKISEIAANLKHFKGMLKNGTPSAVSVAEEINLYYVAITRAKNTLIDNTPNEWLCSATEKEIDEEVKRLKKSKVR